MPRDTAAILPTLRSTNCTEYARFASSPGGYTPAVTLAAANRSHRASIMAPMPSAAAPPDSTMKRYNTSGRSVANFAATSTMIW